MAYSLDELVEQSRAGPSSAELCKICLRTRARYTCPRCNTPYCSLDCYKSEIHIDCSEGFYQEWVEGELKSNRVTAEGRRKMLEILQRMKEEEEGGDMEETLDSDDEPSDSDLAERMNGVDLDNADAVWSKLTNAEKSAFEELVKSGEVVTLVPPWEPWWAARFEEPKVTLLGTDPMAEEKALSHMKNCPILLSNIKPLSSLTKSRPSHSVLFDLMNILGSYCMVARFYNGDHFDFKEEACSLLYTISQSIVAPENFSSTEMALEAVGLKALITDGLEIGEDDIVLMKNDVNLIINGPSRNKQKFYILAALSDMHKLFSFKKSEITGGKFAQKFGNGPIELKPLSKKTYNACLRRFEYLLSFTDSFDFSDIL